MPNSTVVSVDSAGSVGSRRSYTRQYHTVNRTSTVDETLFGSPQRTRSRENKGDEELMISRQRSPKTKGN
ncbi:hypothetical protein AC249_AIPGENE6036 [Exaiptasia diaphana]|nr:hypothetical protein AC249_AIPGENE6036 [Exaiptasia diaphana]